MRFPEKLEQLFIFLKDTLSLKLFISIFSVKIGLLITQNIENMSFIKKNELFTEQQVMKFRLNFSVKMSENGKKPTFCRATNNEIPSQFFR